jgi:serine/threonine protein kinase
MAAEFDRRVRELFDRALERLETERIDFVRKECAGDAALFETVERLLVARGAAQSFMSSGSQPARQIGRYIIHSELGRGGMGIVYDAMDPVIGRNVAVKVINLNTVTEPSQAELMRDCLFREARSCGQLFHPGIVVIFDVGQEEQSAFIAMERVDGPSLHQTLSSPGRAFSIKESLRILQQISAALDYAHQNGIVHRDIKPANIMIRRDGTVKVTDFGIAKVMSRQSTNITSVVMGTPSYMSPEQIEARRIDGRSDQFSLAVLAFEMLAGERPFRADSLPAMAHSIVYGVRPSPRTLNPALPAGFDPIFQRGLARLSEDRYPTCTEFVGALQQVFDSEVASEQIAQTRKQPVVEQRAPRASKFLNPFAVAAAISVAAAMAFFFYHGDLSSTLAPLPDKKPLAVAPQPSATPSLIAASVPAPSAAQPIASHLPPVVKQFRADPTSIKNGNPVVLIWDVTGADAVVIDHGVGKVAPKGLFAVVPAVSTTYSLSAIDAAGKTYRTASVDVQPDPDSIPPSVRAEQLLSDAQTKRQNGRPEESAALLSRSAELGNTTAMVELGEDYSTGEGVPQDENKALSWFRRAAEAGNSSGMLSLGGLYLLGIDGADPDEAEAAHWFQKAADRENPAAMYDLATMYESGRGVARSLEKARDFYQKAARLGNSEAQKRLAQLQSHK